MKSRLSILKVCGLAALVCAALLVTSSPTAVSEPLVSAQAIGHISNGSGNVETDVSKMTINGLLGRFSQTEIRPGDREVLAMAVAVCDAGTIASTTVSILPDIVSGTPSIAGGLAALPCISLGGSDGLHTGVNGAVLTFTGPLAQHMGTVRMYADLDFDGRLFEGGDLIGQQVPVMQGNGEVIAQFGRGQGQFLSTSAGQPLIAPDLPAIFAAFGVPPLGFSAPRIILFTVDVSSTSPGGRVEVAMGLQVGDDTAQGMFGFCFTAFPVINPPGFNCGSNIRGGGPVTHFFDVVGSGGGAIPPGGPPPPPPPPPSGGSGGSTLSSYDSNGNCSLDNAEFFSLVDSWLGEVVTDNVFFNGIDAWVSESNICNAVASGVATKNDLVDPVMAEFSASTDRVTFRASGLNTASMDVGVYALDGSQVYSGSAYGQQLMWNLRSSTGPVANGVYFYHVTTKDAAGSIVQNDVRRIAIVR